MNDFTKEELHTLFDLFHWASDSPSWRSTEGWDDVLQAKIQSMIDNYGEHNEICGNCRTPRAGEYLNSFWDNGHWTGGGAYCGRWIK